MTLIRLIRGALAPLFTSPKSLINDMKTIIKFLAIIAYLGGLILSIFYSILNPGAMYRALSSWDGDFLTKLSAGFLVSSWIFAGIVIIWMIADRIWERKD